MAIAESADSALGQIARTALGAWSDVDPMALTDSLQHPTAELLLAHLGMLYRFGADAAFPNEVRQAVEDTVMTSTVPAR